MSSPPNDTPLDLSALRIDRGPGPARRSRGRSPRWIRWVVVLALLAGLGSLFFVLAKRPELPG